MTHAQRPFRSAQPGELPVSVAEAKAHLRVEHDEDDTMIAAMIAAAVGHLDGWSGILGRCLVAQEWTRDLAGFPTCRELRLPFCDASDVSVSYYAPGATERSTLASSGWHLVEGAAAAAVHLAASSKWPSTADRPDAVRVVATYGYGAPSDIPGPILAAILLMVGDLYRFRETAVTGAGSARVVMSMTVEALLAPYRQICSAQP